MKNVRLTATTIMAVMACAPLSRGGDTDRSGTSKAITAADVRARIFIVAHDSMKGRQAGYPGNYAMTEYLAREAAAMGLEPGGENGSWFQNVPMVLRATDSSSSLVVNGRALVLFDDFAPVRPSATVRFGTGFQSGGVTAIYGGRAGDTITTITREQAAGRLVVLDAPLNASGVPTGVYTAPAAIAISRFPTAAAIAIASLDIVTPATASTLRSRGAGLQHGQAAASRPSGMLLSTSAAEAIMGAPLASLRPGAGGRSVRMKIAFTERPVLAPARNVIAIVRGSDPLLRGQFVAVGAHNDHLGVTSRPLEHDSLRAFNRVMRPEGAQSPARQPTPEQWKTIRSILDSLRRIRPARIDSISNGADDDGSGSVAALEAAQAIASGPKPRRSIVFIWHTAEESGLLGSAWFTDHPT
ncbi:MAG TPA: M28 family peptidase, partial [Gemmatimonadaceae bacterium]|nr:M28 family peptidase [Gemmatimonadaceae bacterium]